MKIIEIIASIIKKDPVVKFDDRLGYDKRYSISTEKIKHELGWSPNVDFFEGLSEYIYKLEIL